MAMALDMACCPEWCYVQPDFDSTGLLTLATTGVFPNFCLGLGILYSVVVIYGIIFLEFWHWRIMLSAHFVLMVF